ncbi:MAG: hypothetical protein AABY22_27025 [Nanoarchaeota archaeon]
MKKIIWIRGMYYTSSERLWSMRLSKWQGKDQGEFVYVFGSREKARKYIKENPDCKFTKPKRWVEA